MKINLEERVGGTEKELRQEKTDPQPEIYHPQAESLPRGAGAVIVDPRGMGVTVGDLEVAGEKKEILDAEMTGTLGVEMILERETIEILDVEMIGIEILDVEMIGIEILEGETIEILVGEMIEILEDEAMIKILDGGMIGTEILDVETTETLVVVEKIEILTAVLLPAKTGISETEEHHPERIDGDRIGIEKDSLTEPRPGRRETGVEGEERSAGEGIPGETGVRRRERSEEEEEAGPGEAEGPGETPGERGRPAVRGKGGAVAGTTGDQPETKNGTTPEEVSDRCQVVCLSSPRKPQVEIHW